MYTFVVVLHIIVCVVLVLSVLLQQGKGAEVGAVFGSSEAVFGSAGPASLLSKITTAVAVVFMVTSLCLTYLAAHHEGGSVMKGVGEVAVPSTPPVSQQPASSSSPVTSSDLPAGNLSVNIGEQKKKAVDSSDNREVVQDNKVERGPAEGAAASE
jgi:preprotein translocase subunit SecG